MYICIDSLLVALIFKDWFFKARFFRRGWIVLVLGCFGPPRISSYIIVYDILYIYNFILHRILLYNIRFIAFFRVRFVRGGWIVLVLGC